MCFRKKYRSSPLFVVAFRCLSFTLALHLYHLCCRLTLSSHIHHLALSRTTQPMRFTSFPVTHNFKTRRIGRNSCRHSHTLPSPSDLMNVPWSVGGGDLPRVMLEIKSTYVHQLPLPSCSIVFKYTLALIIAKPQQKACGYPQGDWSLCHHPNQGIQHP